MITMRRYIFVQPIHPLFGQEFELVEYRNNWGEDRVYFFNTKGEVQSIAASCTDAAGVDPFVEISAGRSFFCTRPPPFYSSLRVVFFMASRIIGCSDWSSSSWLTMSRVYSCIASCQTQ